MSMELKIHMTPIDNTLQAIPDHNIMPKNPYHLFLGYNERITKGRNNSSLLNMLRN